MNNQYEQQLKVQKHGSSGYLNGGKLRSDINIFFQYFQFFYQFNFYYETIICYLRLNIKV